MSGVRVLVGTRRAFHYHIRWQSRTMGHRRPPFWQLEIYTSKAHPWILTGCTRRSASSWYGQLIQSSNDGGKTWAPVGKTFAYDGVPGTHQHYDDTRTRGSSNGYGIWNLR